jgi:hypothetical protein
MGICPKDFKPCCDDICYGGGCIHTGESMLRQCTGCNEYVSEDGGDECSCEPDYDDDYADDLDYGGDPSGGNRR